MYTKKWTHIIIGGETYMFFFFLEEDTSTGSYTSPFDSIKQLDDEGNEYWYARDLQGILEYSEWRNFYKIIEKAKNACEASGHMVQSEFVDVNKLVDVGANLQRSIQDIVLSRYACYLIAMNGNPRKEVIALAQTYFAIKTHKQEQLELQKEDSLRLQIRQDIKEHNISLAEAANQAGIKEPKDYAIFQNEGYKGLYGGLGVKQIHARKGLKKSQKILDHMGNTELAANLFRATQTDEKLRREGIKGKPQANKVHHDVGAKVRQTIKELGGTMPEDLDTPTKSIQQIKKKDKRSFQNNTQGRVLSLVVNIIYCDLPHVNAVLEKCEDIDTYNLYINKNLSHDRMREEIKHELIHIINDDFNVDYHVNIVEHRVRMSQVEDEALNEIDFYHYII